tara:strand:- start:257 stop:643 length:387 start_codon:yes stop_codon:yes gene_type:complete
MKLKITMSQWIEMGKKLGAFKGSQTKGRIIFALPEESGLHEEDFEEIIKEKDPFIDIQEGGESWIDSIIGDGCKEDCPCGCGGGEDCACNGPSSVNKEHLGLTEDKEEDKEMDRDSIHDLIDKIIDIQ